MNRISEAKASWVGIGYLKDASGIKTSKFQVRKGADGLCSLRKGLIAMIQRKRMNVLRQTWCVKRWHWQNQRRKRDWNLWIAHESRWWKRAIKRPLWKAVKWY